MKILVTGSNGFVGKNLCATLKYSDYTVATFDKSNSMEELEAMLLEADFIVHLAGSNRPVNPEEFYSVNQDLTANMLKILVANGETGAEVMIYRYPNLFGKWSQPNYNTVVATWCHNISRDLPITVNDPSVELELVYVDDVIAEIMKSIEGKGNQVKPYYHEVPVSHKVTLGEIHELLQKFKASRQDLFVPNMEPGFETKLYSTYLSFLPTDQFSYPLTMHKDERGSFTEFIKSNDRGQVSINVSRPGITKGEHWHHSKNEKFLVVKGSGVIQLRNIFSDEVIEYFVNGDALEVVDIPTGYTHNIINNTNEDMVTVMWVNEPFDPSTPDTFFEKVK